MTTEMSDTTRYIAFLRAINVGGRNIRMEQLRATFEALDLTHVETFIASGNVIFETQPTDAAELETRIERHLRETLGYRVDTYLRTTRELADIASYQPFPATDANAEGSGLYVGFLHHPPSQAQQDRVAALRTATDEFHIHGRELYWLIRGKLSDSSITGAMLEKAVGSPSTSRNITTIRRLAAKYPPS
jgi:uncharacterized protein (DUF1697 family)